MKFASEKEKRFATVVLVGEKTENYLDLIKQQDQNKLFISYIVYQIKPTV